MVLLHDLPILKGLLFLKSFKRKEVSVDHYFGRAIAYIHLNPVKHGFVSHAFDWEWTSHHDYLYQQSLFINRQPAWNWFGPIESLRSFHNTAVKEMAGTATALFVFEDD